MNSAERTWLILNPAAGKGRAEQIWPTIAARLQTCGIRFTQAVTCGPGDASLLAQQALADGATQLIVVGGDGTLNEVVNGLATAQIEKARLPTLALLPLGTGTDFARGYGIRSLDDALITLQHGQRRTLDLGVARFRDPRGAEQERAFVNVADCGLGPVASQQIARVDRRLGSGAYLYGALRAIAAYAPVPTRIAVDDRVVYDAPCGLLAIGNGCYFGGGMRITPLAHTDDGLLDVVILGATDRRTLVGELLPRVYRGSQLRHPAVHFARGTAITVEADPPLPLELDGEIVGTTPARFTVPPARLSLLAPRRERRS
ncbi:MAG TPA: diacylglycerol kinase family protein [Thermomicrobiales bacterium]